MTSGPAASRRRFAGPIAPGVGAARSGVIAFVLALAAWSVLALSGQPDRPPPWIDEGLNLGVARSLADSGLYALPDHLAPRVMDPAIQSGAGPLVLMPAAWLLRLGGPQLLLARSVVWCYAVVALAAYVWLAVRLLGRAAPLATLLLLVGSAEPFASFSFLSAQLMGEVPALAFYLVGLLLWLRALDRGTEGAGFAWAGLLWGCAAVTKSQLLFLLPAALGLVALADRFWHRRAGLAAFLVPAVTAGGVVVAWNVAQYVIAGPALYVANARALSQAFPLHVMGFDPAHERNALGVLWRSGYWWWGLPGLAWAVWRGAERSAAGLQMTAAVSLPLVGLLWFTGLSIGWGRYACYALMLTPLFTAGALKDVAARVGSESRATWRGVVLAATTAIYVAANGWTTATTALHPVDTGYAAFARYLATEVPATAVVESWEWELSLAARQRFHFPATRFLWDEVRRQWARQPSPAAEVYDPLAVKPDYIVVGPFGTWTSVYARAVSTHGILVARRGEYALYRIR